MQFYSPIVIFIAMTVLYTALVLDMKIEDYLRAKTDNATPFSQFSTNTMAVNQKREPSA